jgi:hypothetical protein
MLMAAAATEPNIAPSDLQFKPMMIPFAEDAPPSVKPCQSDEFAAGPAKRSPRLQGAVSAMISSGETTTSPPATRFVVSV